MKKRSFEAFPNIFLGRFAHSNSPNMTYRLKKDHNKLEFSRIYIGNPSMTDGHSLPGESPSIPRPTVVAFFGAGKSTSRKVHEFVGQKKTRFAVGLQYLYGTIRRGCCLLRHNLCRALVRSRYKGRNRIHEKCFW